MDALDSRVKKIEANYANRVYLTVLGCFQAILSICLWLSNGNHRPIIVPEANNTGPSAPSASGNTVTIGDAKKPEPQRDYLTTLELGDREGVAQRTITTWIAEGRITPTPIQKGRCWLIDTQYKILPPK